MAKASYAEVTERPVLVEFSKRELTVLRKFLWSGGEWPKAPSQDGIVLNEILKAIDPYVARPIGQ